MWLIFIHHPREVFDISLVYVDRQVLACCPTIGTKLIVTLCSELDQLSAALIERLLACYRRIRFFELPAGCVPVEYTENKLLIKVC